MAKPIREFSPEHKPDAHSPFNKQDPTCIAGEAKPSAVAYPVITERAEWSEVITLYDRQHFLTYARLLSAEKDKVDWRDGVRNILLQDPDKDPRRARVCWESHLERARWIASEGLQLAVARANAQ